MRLTNANEEIRPGIRFPDFSSMSFIRIMNGKVRGLELFFINKITGTLYDKFFHE